jgi:hypothetical protein
MHRRLYLVLLILLLAILILIVIVILCRTHAEPRFMYGNPH